VKVGILALPRTSCLLLNTRVRIDNRVCYCVRPWTARRECTSVSNHAYDRRVHTGCESKMREAFGLLLPTSQVLFGSATSLSLLVHLFCPRTWDLSKSSECGRDTRGTVRLHLFLLHNNLPQFVQEFIIIRQNTALHPKSSKPERVLTGKMCVGLA
jgi:hypothetical protein